MLTYLIIGITVIVSLLAFNRPEIGEKMRFNAYLIHHNKQWYRFLSYGLIHADYVHLMVNMFVLYSFGGVVEIFFAEYFENTAGLYFCILYIGGIAFSTLVDFGLHKNDPYYNAVGASGAVSAVLFSSILLYPAGRIYLFFIPIGIPAPLFGLLYLIYSAYMAKKSNDNIGHNAHFWGAIFGLGFTILLDWNILIIFLDQLSSIFS